MPLPPLYERWVVELLGAESPEEEHATCASCAMCSDAGGVPDPTEAFDAAVKCCSYVPVLANFGAGGLLRDRDPRLAFGRSSAEQRIAERVGVTPLGIGRSPLYVHLYRHGAPSAYGRTRSMRCPHYSEQSGTCGIWQYRDATCATWFCKHSRGAVGEHFWRRALQPLLAAAETGLARWCLLELGWDGERLEVLLAASAAASRHTLERHDLDHQVDEELYSALWGRDAGREREHFIQCAELVSSLAWTKVVEICGADLAVRARVARTAFERLSRVDLPAALSLAPVRVRQGRRGHVTLEAYSPHDRLDAPREILDALPAFDGRPTREVLAALTRSGVELGSELVQKLVDFEVLHATEGAPDPARSPVPSRAAKRAKPARPRDTSS